MDSQVLGGSKDFFFSRYSINSVKQRRNQRLKKPKTQKNKNGSLNKLGFCSYYTKKIFFLKNLKN